MAANGCVFCAIVNGKAEASIVYSDDDIVTFMDLQPVTLDTSSSSLAGMQSDSAT